ncbi:MAG: hypothetical protein FWG85_01665 [Bacteroidetes bacterium]|nr:hypothetical protein [Bacteroidota bacterium]
MYLSKELISLKKLISFINSRRLPAVDSLDIGLFVVVLSMIILPVAFVFSGIGECVASKLPML